MKSISEFFARIQGKYGVEIRLRVAVQEIIERYTKIKPPLDAISFSIKTVNIKGLSQGAKSFLFTKNTLILKELTEKVPSRVIENINLN